MIRLRALSNGVRVVTEQVASVRSCGIGLWLETGSRYEASAERGLTHFIEHMLFKGTRRRDVRQLADAMNFLGGNMNAFTTQETLCLHARTIDRKAPQALDLMFEMLLASVFPPAEICRERRVVLEECRMIEDAPDDFSMDNFLRNLWPGHPLGEPVIGRPATIRRFTRAEMLERWEREFAPERLVVALAGAFDARACERVIRRWLGRLAGAGAPLRRSPRPDARLSPRQTILRRSVEQAHFCLGVPGPHHRAPERFAFSLMNMVLGGGLSSRLFREVREKRGLAYSIGSFTHYFSDSGYFAVSGGVSPHTLREVLTITCNEIQRICEEPVPGPELELARAQALDAIVMGLENMETRMTRLADGLLTWGRVTPIDEVVDEVNRVTPEDVRRVARRYLYGRTPALSLVAPRGCRPLTLGPIPGGGIQ